MANTSLFRTTDIDFRDPSVVTYCKLSATTNTLTLSGVGGAFVELKGVATPATDNSAATKAYVDSVAAGANWKSSAKVATTANGVLATAYANGQVVDGITLATNDRILLKDQTNAVENGIYTVNASGAPTRSSDLSAGATASGIALFVREGTVNADTAYICTTDGSSTVGTDPINFTEFSRLGQITAGEGLTKTANTLSVNVDNSTIEITTDTLQVKNAGITNAKLQNPSLTVTAGDGLQTGGLVALGSSVTLDVNATVVRTSGVQTIGGAKTLTSILTSTTGGFKLNNSIPLTLGTSDNLTFLYNGTNSLLTSNSGNLLLDNTNATGKTQLQLGTDTNATRFEVLNDTGASLFYVQGDGIVGPTTAFTGNWVFTGNNAGLSGDTNLITLATGPSTVTLNSTTRILNDKNLYIGDTEKFKLLYDTSGSKSILESNAVGYGLYVQNLDTTSNLILKTGSTNDTATSLQYVDGGNTVRFQVNANGTGFITGNFDAQNGVDVTGAALTTAVGSTNTAGEVLISGGNFRINNNLDLRIGTTNIGRIFGDGTNTTIRGDTGNLITEVLGTSAIIEERLANSATSLFQVNGGAGNTRFSIVGSTGQATFSGNVDANSGIDVTGAALTTAVGITNTAGEVLISGGNFQLNDNINLTIGTGDDLTLVHDGTNTNITNATGNLVISNNDTASKTIIKLGTNSTTTAFEVQSADTSSKVKVEGDGKLTATGLVRITNTTGSTSTSTGALVVSGGAGISNDLYIGGDSYASSHINTSDARLKENITPLTDEDIDKLRRLNPVTFTWKDKNKGSRLNYGFLAQEVREIFPDLVHEDADGNLSMDYIGIIALLVKSLPRSR